MIQFSLTIAQNVNFSELEIKSPYFSVILDNFFSSWLFSDMKQLFCEFCGYWRARKSNPDKLASLKMISSSYMYCAVLEP